MSNSVVTDWPSGSANTGWPQEPTGMLLPGRVQGWPAGTQRAANAAERLLSQAVAWWDVGQYRDGDRFLRNRGTGGELLDLRLGSSIAPNSNDPLYLPSADDGYVYLSGVAGNSLSVTAPATATQYIAYPLDRSASTATGAVVGGATFTFSTTGSWRLIELLDASNVVVDTIDCDVITSGSATSFTSGIVNQTVTINRSTSGRKSVAVPSRHKGGRPVMLLGTDDYLQVQDNWQHGLLNFNTGQPLTVVAVFRQWSGTLANKQILAKRQARTVGPGYMMIIASVSNSFEVYLETPVVSNRRVSSSTSGLVTTLSLTRQPSGDYALRSNADVSATWTHQSSLANTLPLRVGAESGSIGESGDFEFYGAVVDRRAWSPAQIKIAADYYTGRIA